MTTTLCIGGDAHPSLAAEVARLAGCPLVSNCVSAFADGETRVRIEEDVAGADVYIVQPTPAPVGENLVKLALIADAARDRGAARVTAVIPYFGFARQDVRRPGEPLSVQVAARILEAAGIDRTIVLELHSEASHGAFSMPLIHLRADEPVLDWIDRNRAADLVIVSPDAGGLKRAQRYAAALGVPLAIVAKARPRADQAVPLYCLGDVQGRSCLIVDDMASTGRTAANAAQALFGAGARAVDALFVHAVMAQGALERLQSAGMQRIAATDSLPAAASREALTRIRVAPLLARGITRMAEQSSKE
jgi:ribose-phosphate pyrophosphokinase